MWTGVMTPTADCPSYLVGGFWPAVTGRMRSLLAQTVRRPMGADFGGLRDTGVGPNGAPRTRHSDAAMRAS